MNDTTMSRAMAEATPLHKTKIRLVSWSAKDRVLTMYFSDNSLIGRRFSTTLIGGDMSVRVIEDDGGQVVRLASGSRTSNSLRAAFGKHHKNAVGLLSWASFRREILVMPTWANGRLSYHFDLPAPDEKDDDSPPVGVKPEPRMPRPDTLRDMLAQLRKIERETPYRLDRAVDGTLEFVARIK
jgi:hypothetical protein